MIQKIHFVLHLIEYIGGTKDQLGNVINAFPYKGAKWYINV